VRDGQGPPGSDLPKTGAGAGRRHARRLTPEGVIVDLRCARDRAPLGRIGLLLGLWMLIGFGGARPLSAASVHTITVTLREFSVVPSRVQLKVGEAVELTLRNAGLLTRDWMAGSGLVSAPDAKGFRRDLLSLLQPKETGVRYVRAHAGMAGEADGLKWVSEGMEIEPGGEVTLRFTVPAIARGTWNMVWVFPGPYESGAAGTLEIG
jgi:hypothetical protein